MTRTETQRSLRTLNLERRTRGEFVDLPGIIIKQLCGEYDRIKTEITNDNISVHATAQDKKDFHLILLYEEAMMQRKELLPGLIGYHTPPGNIICAAEVNEEQESTVSMLYNTLSIKRY